MRLVQWYTNWDNGSEFPVEIFEELADAQKYLNEMFLSELDTFLIDKEDKDDILNEFGKKESFEREQWEEDFTIQYDRSVSFEINITGEYISYFQLKEISFNILYK